MASQLIKICGVRDVKTALAAIHAGAHWIGLVFHPASPRYIDLSDAMRLCKVIHENGGKPVGVFVNHPLKTMQNICVQTGIRIVQLHGPIARKEHAGLPSDYQRIYVQNLSIEGQYLHHEGFQALDRARDYVLIDHEHPGCGQVINPTRFKAPLHFPWLLSGGLTPNNVSEMIHRYQPHGVDVSSGVEHVMGQKDPFLIHQFIRAARK